MSQLMLTDQDLAKNALLFNKEELQIIRFVILSNRIFEIDLLLDIIHYLPDLVGAFIKKGSLIVNLSLKVVQCQKQVISLELHSVDFDKKNVNLLIRPLINRSILLKILKRIKLPEALNYDDNRHRFTYTQDKVNLLRLDTKEGEMTIDFQLQAI
ncbi:MAG: hypothetical protein MK193_13120 [Lentisphaeria bacterium]|nr:hypothetical protein [Lentisphaeria bacterium]